MIRSSFNSLSHFFKRTGNLYKGLPSWVSKLLIGFFCLALLILATSLSLTYWIVENSEEAKAILEKQLDTSTQIQQSQESTVVPTNQQSVHIIWVFIYGFGAGIFGLIFIGAGKNLQDQFGKGN